MQTVGAYHEVEPALASIFELDMHTVSTLLKTNDLVVENDFLDR